MSRVTCVPPKDESNLVSKSVSLPGEQWDELEGLRKQLRMAGSVSEVVRTAVALGIVELKGLASQDLDYANKLVDAENKKLLNRKLRSRDGKMEEAIEGLAEELGEEHSLVKVLKECLKD